MTEVIELTGQSAWPFLGQLVLCLFGLGFIAFIILIAFSMQGEPPRGKAARGIAIAVFAYLLYVVAIHPLFTFSRVRVKADGTWRIENALGMRVGRITADTPTRVLYDEVTEHHSGRGMETLHNAVVVLETPTHRYVSREDARRLVEPGYRQLAAARAALGPNGASQAAHPDPDRAPLVGFIGAGLIFLFAAALTLRWLLTRRLARSFARAERDEPADGRVWRRGRLAAAVEVTIAVRKARSRDAWYAEGLADGPVEWTPGEADLIEADADAPASYRDDGQRARVRLTGAWFPTPPHEKGEDGPTYLRRMGFVAKSSAEDGAPVQRFCRRLEEGAEVELCAIPGDAESHQPTVIVDPALAPRGTWAKAAHDEVDARASFLLFCTIALLVLGLPLVATIALYVR